MAFQQSMRAAAVIMRCSNVRSGHAAKGHQLSDGRVFARGAYESSFSFDTNRIQVLDNIYIRYHTYMEKLSQLTRRGHSRPDAASAIHQHDVLASLFSPNEKDRADAVSHTTFCVCCLFGTPETSCANGHMLCRDCLLSYGVRKGRSLVELLACPLKHIQDAPSRPGSVYLRPEAAGVRVLALNKYVISFPFESCVHIISLETPLA